MIRRLKPAIILLFFFSPFSSISAADPLDVVFNELAWMGSQISPNHEWIELYNNTNYLVNLEGWTLKASDGIPEIKLTGHILPSGYCLLERINDEAVFSMPADLIYQGALKNEGESLALYDNSGNLIDFLDCSSGWFAGNNFSKQTMERKNPRSSASDSLNWQDSQNTGGSPKAVNDITSGAPSSSKRDGELPSEPQAATYPSGIVINEILPSPDGPDENEEWIEILNKNNFKVELSYWKIEDVTGARNVYVFPEGTSIPAQEFLVLGRPTTKIVLNNDADGLNFIQPDGKIISSVAYEKAPRNQSYVLTDSGWGWSTILTPGSANVTPILMTKDKEDRSEEELIPGKENKERQLQQEIAAIGRQVPEETPSFFFLPAALAVAVFSGLTILIIKSKVKKS